MERRAENESKQLIKKIQTICYAMGKKKMFQTNSKESE